MGRIEAEGNINTTNTMRDNTPKSDIETGKMVKPKDEAEMKEMLEAASAVGRSYFGVTRKGDRYIVEMDNTTAEILIMGMALAHTRLCADGECSANQQIEESLNAMPPEVRAAANSGLARMAATLANVSKRASSIPNN